MSVVKEIAIAYLRISNLKLKFETDKEFSYCNELRASQVLEKENLRLELAKNIIDALFKEIFEENIK